MILSLRALTNSGFAGEASGIDLTRPLAREDVRAIDDAMDQYGVLVFHDQRFTDETQMAFSRNFGELEFSNGAELYKERRLPQMEMADISNLDTSGKLRPADDHMRLTALGNRLWHSDASFRAIPAKYSLLSARIIPSRGGNTVRNFLKNGGGASTLQIISSLRAYLPDILPTLPTDNIKVAPLFDQSVFVKASVTAVVVEALIAAGARVAVSARQAPLLEQLCAGHDA